MTGMGVGILAFLVVLTGILFYVEQGTTAFVTGPTGSVNIPLWGWVFAGLTGIVVLVGYWNAVQKMRMKKNDLR